MQTRDARDPEAARSDDPPAAPAAPTRRGRGRPRDPSVDGRITAAAAELLLRRGFDNTTVDDVAALAGVGKATVYRRWPSKEDLALAAMTELFANEFPEPDTGSIRSDVEASIRGILTFVNTTEGEAFFRMTIAESIRDPRIAALYRESVQRSEERGRRILRRGVERGEVRPDFDVEVALQWLTGMLAARVISGQPLPGVDRAEAYTDWVLHGIACRHPGV